MVVSENFASSNGVFTRDSTNIDRFLGFISTSILAYSSGCFLVMLGALVCVVTWKLFKMKTSLERLIKSVEAHIYVQPQGQVRNPLDELLRYEIEKKNTIVH